MTYLLIPLTFCLDLILEFMFRVPFCRGHRHIFTKYNILRVIFQARVNMFTGGDDTDTFEKRAVEAEETISLLQSQLMLLKKAAGILLKNYG